MSIRKGRMLSIAGMMVPTLVLGCIGVGVLVWLQSWHGDFISAAGQSGAIDDPMPQEMLDGLRSRASVMTVVVAVVTALGLAFGARELWRASKTAGHKLQAVAGSVAAAASELLAVAAQMAASATQTSTATTQTTATVEEVRQTAALAQEKAAEAAELTSNVLQSYEVAESVSRTNAETFDQTRSAMDVIGEATVRLDEEAEAVGDIMTRVNDLAEQSNLLSVNASIEAVKAGEAGRGFTVVAQEVKSLAGQSKDAVSRVRVVLDDVRKAIALVKNAVDEGREVTEKGVSQFHRSVEGIKGRAATAGRAAEAVSRISATTQQQLSGMQQIEQAILSIDESGRQSVLASKQVEEEAKRLQELVVEMRSLVGGALVGLEAAPGLSR